MSLSSKIVFGALLLCSGLAFAAFNHIYSPQALALEKNAAANSAERTAVQDRVNRLALDRCKSRSSELSALHARSPITATQQIPVELRDDLKLCVDRSIMSAAVTRDLSDQNLLVFITASK